MTDEKLPDWVFGRWVILPEDRDPQTGVGKLWTLMDRTREWECGSLCRGPLGRKSSDTESVLWGDDEGGVGIDGDFVPFLLEKLNA